MNVISNTQIAVNDGTCPLILDWREYQKTESGGRYYPSKYSLAWHIRKYRKQLIQSGALIKLRGKDHLIVNLFEDQIIQLGMQEAKKSIGSQL